MPQPRGPDPVLTRSIPRSVWWGWGDPADAHPVKASAWAAIEETLGYRRPLAPRTPVPLAEVRLPEPRLAAAALVALAAVVGDEHVSQERAERVEHAGGKAYPDIYRLFHGDASHAPDAAVYPADAAQVAAVLTVCAEHRVAVVPFGGGTSVVGGLEPLAGDLTGVVSLDLRRLSRMLACDPRSRVATFEPGIRGPEVEQALQPLGLTLGHYPQSHQEATLGGYVVTRSAGQASTGYGRPDEHLLGARVATPTGELVLGGRAPASAAGPRLLDVVAGSEGTLGVLTEVTLALQALPAYKRYAAWFLPSFADGVDAVRALAQDLDRGMVADVTRLSDAEETRVSLSLAGGAGRAMLRYAAARGRHAPCLLVLVWEGADRDVLAVREKQCTGVLRAHGGLRLPERVARGWEVGRFAGPYLRDQLMTAGVLAETLETATTWDNTGRLYEAVAGAVRGALEADGRRSVVMCHVSHVYGSGSSLYFMFAAPEGEDPLRLWREVKEAAGRAIVEHGGTISHHHGVGRDHLPHVREELGEVGVRMLRALKAELDPVGILNPGKTIPSTSGHAGPTDPSAMLHPDTTVARQS